MMRTAIGLSLALALTACGGGGSSKKHTVFMSGEAVQSRIMALADCPSPLTRLGIVRVRPRIMVGPADVVDLVIPSSEDSAGSVVHFKLARQANEPGLKISWTVELSDAASEVDLGEDRLLNPLNLAKDLDKSVSDYLEYFAQTSSTEQSDYSGKKQLAATCRTIGRLIDGIAVTTNPGLRQTLEKQKRRDALGWLFKDGYRLKTDSPPEAYWDGDSDYSGNEY